MRVKGVQVGRFEVDGGAEKVVDTGSFTFCGQTDGHRGRIGMLVLRALRSLLCVVSCAWLHAGAASRLKSPALPIQSEREPLPSKGLSGKKSYTLMSPVISYQQLFSSGWGLLYSEVG